MIRNKVLTIARIDNGLPINHISGILDGLNKNNIDQLSWPGNGYKPRVSFVITHNDEGVVVKFYVAEDSIRAFNTTNNSAVYEDSCVELFVSFGDEDKYYNFEFNCLGACLAGYGASRNGRVLLPPDVINLIRVSPEIIPAGQAGKKQVYWQLTALIPLKAFYYHPKLVLDGKKARMNFYKCGDLLPLPHYLSWKKINAAEPNFHLPEFFGDCVFA